MASSGLATSTASSMVVLLERLLWVATSVPRQAEAWALVDSARSPLGHAVFQSLAETRSTPVPLAIR